VPDWAYIAMAYTVVWGALAGYALLLARRVTQAEMVDQRLQEPGPERDGACEVPPAR
jgi:hypothetical protein